jgi:NAD(P)-dependent dehydrogenase (short-subunit alcohol dehydrogenase family)
MDISACHAVVTGGASGLGRATAARVAAEGGKVTILDRDAARGEAAAKALGKAARFQELDVTDEAAMAQAVAGSIGAFGPLTLAVSCAGVATPGRILGREGVLPLETYATVIGINLIGTFNLLKAAADAMQANDTDADGTRGLIVNTASVAAYEGQVGQAAYASSKGGVVGLTLPAARELAQFGIRVMTIAPGLFLTPMMAGLPEDVQKSLAAATPFPKRLGTPEEYADLVAYLYGNNMLNGEVIRLDGAVRLAAR